MPHCCILSGKRYVRMAWGKQCFDLLPWKETAADHMADIDGSSVLNTLTTNTGICCTSSLVKWGGGMGFICNQWRPSPLIVGQGFAGKPHRLFVCVGRGHMGGAGQKYLDTQIKVEGGDRGPGLFLGLVVKWISQVQFSLSQYIWCNT